MESLNFYKVGTDLGVLYRPSFRFAPSPTGDLHIGGVFTATVCDILARKYNGTFNLRIEDTDSTRSDDKFIQPIIDGMNYLNLKYDKFHIQSDRLAIYRAVAGYLCVQGSAYRCFVPKHVLAEIKAGKLEYAVDLMYEYYRECDPNFRPRVSGKFSSVEQFKELLLDNFTTASSSDAYYDSTAAWVTPIPEPNTENYVLRLASSAGVKFIDGSNVAVYYGWAGKTNASTVSDRNIVLLKADKTPTYFLASSVDNFIASEVVFRGREWKPTTTVMSRIYECLRRMFNNIHGNFRLIVNESSPYVWAVPEKLRSEILIVELRNMMFDPYTLLSEHLDQSDIDSSPVIAEVTRNYKHSNLNYSDKRIPRASGSFADGTRLFFTAPYLLNTTPSVYPNTFVYGPLLLSKEGGKISKRRIVKGEPSIFTFSNFPFHPDAIYSWVAHHYFNTPTDLFDRHKIAEAVVPVTLATKQNIIFNYALLQKMNRTLMYQSESKALEHGNMLLSEIAHRSTVGYNIPDYVKIFIARRTNCLEDVAEFLEMIDVVINTPIKLESTIVEEVLNGKLKNGHRLKEARELVVQNMNNVRHIKFDLRSILLLNKENK